MKSCLALTDKQTQGYDVEIYPSIFFDWKPGKETFFICKMELRISI